MSGDGLPAQADATTATTALRRLGQLSLTEYSMASLLQTVADLAKTVMPGSPETSVFVQTAHRRFTVASTGQLALDLDEVQYSEGVGPCLQAASTQSVVEVPDTDVEQRWPDYARRAAEHGNGSSLSVPLHIDDRRSGALNIYARQPHAFDEDSRSAALQFAPFAAAAIANMHAYEDARTMADNLQTALESRAVIEQAKGILMERHKLTPDQAFHHLATASQHTNVKLRDVADHLTRTGELPTAPPSR